jgi:transcriptional regulator with XRE-family HTH domain
MAQAISRFRQTLGDTQQQFANRTGLAMTSVARYETNSPPSQKVLDRFVKIAREADLPAFIEIFEKRLPPSEEIGLQDFAVVKQLLTRLAEDLHPKNFGQGKLALACLLTPAEQFTGTERKLEGVLANTDRAIDEAAAELVRGRDPEVDRKRLHFLRTRDLADWFDFTKAYHEFREARLAEVRSKGLKQKPLLDMFVVRDENPYGVSFELSETSVHFKDEPPLPDDIEEWQRPIDQEVSLDDMATSDGKNLSRDEVLDIDPGEPPSGEDNEC